MRNLWKDLRFGVSATDAQTFALIAPRIAVVALVACGSVAAVLLAVTDDDELE